MAADRDTGDRRFPRIWEDDGADRDDLGTDAPSYLLIQDSPGLDAVATALAESDLVGVDTETTGLDPRTDRVRLLALATDTTDGGTFTYLVDCFAVDPAPLFPVLAEKRLVLHNGAFDLGFLGQLGFEPGNVQDTMLLSQVLRSGETGVRHSLQECCRRELGVALDKGLQRANWSGPLSPAMLEYSARDAEVLRPLFRKLSRQIEAAGLARVARIEGRALPAVVWMARHGVAVDRRRWDKLAEQAAAERDVRLANLARLAPPCRRDGELFASDWNWDSPRDMLAAFEAAGLTLAGTSDAELAEVDHPLAEALRRYRVVAKRLSTCGPDWARRHIRADGRVYPHWLQLPASSGRMACADPNMQQLPRDKAYRCCVVAPPGRLLVQADYSQIELRIAAKISGDEALQQAYRTGEDVHVQTARLVLGALEVTKEHRQLAKAINFGLLYGMGAEGFRTYARAKYGVNLTEFQAAAYRSAFFRAYPGLQAWHLRTPRHGSSHTRTLAGRRRLNVERYPEKLNLPVQGTGADGLKRALALLWERRAEVPGTFPVLAVHDEIVVECDRDQAVSVSEWLKRAMVDAMAPLIDPVPVEVEVEVGPSWGGE